MDIESIGPDLKQEERPLVHWTPAEQQFADEVKRVFREEDR
jgi:hypothetical protein